MPPKTKQQPPTKAPADLGRAFIDFALTEGSAPRRMAVHTPTPEQLAVWQSIGETFTRLGAEWEHGRSLVADLPADHPDAVAFRAKQNRQASRGVGRSIKLIKSVLVEERDHDWVDDMIMEGSTIEQLLRIVSEAVKALRAHAVKNGTTPAAAA